LNESLLQAAAVYQLDEEATHRMFLATQQIASKGTVSSEEIKLQLGEVLPGAYNISARALGMSTSEMSKALERGDVTSADFLPKFQQQLKSETEIAANSISESSTGKINAFNNAITKLQLTVGEGILPVANLGLDIVNSALKGVTGNIDILLQGFRFLVAVLAGSLLKSLFGFVKGLFTARTAMFGVGQAASLVAGMVGKLTARFLLFTAITDTLGLIWQSFQDGSGVIKEFADTSIKNLEAYKKAVLDSQNVGSPGAKKRPANRLELRGESGLEKTFIGQGINALAGAGSFVANPFEIFGKNKVGSGNAARDLERLGSFFGAGEVQKRYKDTIKNTDTISQNNDFISAEIERLFSDPTSDLNKTIAIDNQIEMINRKKRALDPNDKSGIRDLQSQENELIKQREVPFESIGKMSSVLQTQIEGIETTLKELDDLDASGGITGDEYLTRTTKLKADLEILKTKQEDFNKAIRSGV
ncbi:MAG: tape measure protein, partial [Waterburya sp.]